MEEPSVYTYQPVEAFTADLRSICGYFDVRPAKDQSNMRGCARLDTVAGLEVAHMAMDVQQVLRSPHSVRQDSGKHYFLILQEEGTALMSQNDLSVMLSPGDLFLIDSAAPSDFTYFGQFNRQLSLHLPRTEMHSRFGDALLRGGLTMPRSDPTTVALHGVLSKILNSGNVSSAGGYYLREAVMGLLGAMLHERSGREHFAGVEAEIGSSQALTTAMTYIDAHFRNPDITVQNIADNLCISPRQLQRGFASLGTTPTKYLMMKRLEYIRRSLDDRRAGKRDILIASIAYEAGFSDLSYFNRCFRKAFGQSPRAYLDSNS